MTPARRAAVLAFLTAFVTLFVQVLVHRMVSAKLLNNFAFLVISLTMLGFASSAVVLTRHRVRLSNIDRVFPWAAAFFALTLLGAGVAFYQAPNPERVVASRADLVFQLAGLSPLGPPLRGALLLLRLDPGIAALPTPSSPQSGSTSSTSWAPPWEPSP